MLNLVIPVAARSLAAVRAKEQPARQAKSQARFSQKSNIFLDEAYEWFAVLLKHMARDNGLQYMPQPRQTGYAWLQLNDRSPSFSRVTRSSISRRAARLSIKSFSIHTSPKPNKLMLARHAPHAAALFIDGSLSEEGQSMITHFGRIVARKGVKQRFPELVEKRSRTGRGRFHRADSRSLERLERIKSLKNKDQGILGAEGKVRYTARRRPA